MPKLFRDNYSLKEVQFNKRKFKHCGPCNEQFKMFNKRKMQNPKKTYNQPNQK